jgi:hypothetical protein
MKTLKLMLIAGVFLLANSLNAQVSVSVNIGTPPLWGPIGYENVRYYYLPDVEAYYDINSSMFIYFAGGTWVHRAYLPGPYRNYDLYGGYKVVMTDYRGNAPYIYHNKYKVKYHKGYHGKPQKTFGERPGKVNKPRGGEPGHSYKKAQQDHGNPGGPARGNDKHSKGGHGDGGGKKVKGK